MHLGRVLGLAGLLAGLGCTDEFDPYNELHGFRILAVRAASPALLADQATALDALIVSDEPVSYAWSWCPFSAGTVAGFQCALGHDQLQATVDELAGAGAIEIPPYEIGTSSTATFAYTLDPILFQGLCDAISGEGALPDYVELPECNGTFPITIRLDAESGGERISAIKTIDLIYDESAPGADLNQNPTIAGLTFAHPDRLDDVRPLEGATLDRKVEHRLSAEIAEDTAEPTAEGRERLVITWFIEGGETDKARTSFSIEGDQSITDLTENRWTTPSALDYSADAARMILVIRDSRGGVGWLEQRVTLGP